VSDVVRAYSARKTLPSGAMLTFSVSTLARPALAAKRSNALRRVTVQASGDLDRVAAIEDEIVRQASPNRVCGSKSLPTGAFGGCCFQPLSPTSSNRSASPARPDRGAAQQHRSPACGPGVCADQLLCAPQPPAFTPP